jgi:hypothetical protein
MYRFIKFFHQCVPSDSVDMKDRMCVYFRWHKNLLLAVKYCGTHINMNVTPVLH